MFHKLLHVSWELVKPLRCSLDWQKKKTTTLKQYLLKIQRFKDNLFAENILRVYITKFTVTFTLTKFGRGNFNLYISVCALVRVRECVCVCVCMHVCVCVSE
jgi:hypothetical protein